MSGTRSHLSIPCSLVLSIVAVTAEVGADPLNLGAEQRVQANGTDITVPGYSVPSYVDWNNDGLKDLIVGQGSGSQTAKVRIYLNGGTASAPQFSDYVYAQSNGADLTVPGNGCLGVFPRVVYWDTDDRKDLLVGLADGTMKIYLNTGTDDAPVFDGGTTLQVGFVGSKVDMDVGDRATATLVDWDNDGLNDLVVGALDGKIRVYHNCGCSKTEPQFYYAQSGGSPVQEDGSDLVVPEKRSSPVVVDLDGDGKKDILTGDTEGQLLFYRNVGTDEAPSFSGYSLVESDGVPINLPDTPRSRPFVCDWTGDGRPDVLLGAGDGKIRLYQGKQDDGTSELGTLSIDTTPVKGEVFVDGTSWGTAPQSRSVPQGQYTVSFGDVTNYTKPDDQQVQVKVGQTTSVMGTYVQHTGILSVTCTPSDISAAFSVDGTDMGGIPQDVTLGVGEHTVSFANVAGYDTPPDQTVTIKKDETTTVTGIYTVKSCGFPAAFVLLIAILLAARALGTGE